MPSWRPFLLIETTSITYLELAEVGAGGQESKAAGRQKNGAAQSSSVIEGRKGLLGKHEVAAAVQVPALFIRVGAEWLLFAHAVGGNAIARDALLYQCRLHGFGTAGA